MPNSRLTELLTPVRLLAMDVDGVLTDGSITWGADVAGNLHELKRFSVKDGLGLSLVRSVGLQIAWVTGRVSPVVQRRAAELKVEHVCQWARDKRAVLRELLERLELEPAQALFIGDDLNDLPAFEACGVAVAVADAAAVVRERADWITKAPGGAGAVREVAEGVLRAQGRWDEAVTAFLAQLEREQDRPPGAPSQ